MRRYFTSAPEIRATPATTTSRRAANENERTHSRATALMRLRTLEPGRPCRVLAKEVTRLGAVVGAALCMTFIVSPPAGAGGGASGTYSALGTTYYFELQNSGATPWSSFTLVGPSSARFVGGATAGEITAQCVPGQPDGLPNEIQCTSQSASGFQPGTRILFVGTLAAPACGSSYQVVVGGDQAGVAVLGGLCDSVTAVETKKPPARAPAPRRTSPKPARRR